MARMRRLLILLLTTAGMLRIAVAHAQQTPIYVVGGSTQRVCQLTGDTDIATQIATPNRTSSNFGVIGTDLGANFEHEGTLYFLFGDTTGIQDTAIYPAVEPGGLNPVMNLDSVAFTNAPDAKTLCTAANPPALQFVSLPGLGQNGNSLYVPPQIDPNTFPVVASGNSCSEQQNTIPGCPIGHGTFKTPNSGFSWNGEMYVFFTATYPIDSQDYIQNGSDNFAANFCTASPQPIPARRSVLAVADSAQLSQTTAFDFVGEVSTDKLLNVSPVLVRNSDLPGLPVSPSGYGVLLFGTGLYRHSNIYLAYLPLPAGDLSSNLGLLFYAGGGQWSGESQAPALFDISHYPNFNGPAASADCNNALCAGELSVTWNPYLGKWILLYNCLPEDLRATSPRGIRFHTADRPWGPWTDVVMYPDSSHSPATVGQLVTAPSLVFDPTACEDPNCLLGGGYEKFMHLVGADTLFDNAMWQTKFINGMDTLIPQTPLTLVTPRMDCPTCNGGEYAPYVIQRFTTGTPNTATIYYTLSSWNPYQVHVMKTTLHKPIPPVAVASAPTNVAVGVDCTAKVALDGSGSTHDPYTAPLNYTWTWTGPGGATGTASGANPTISLGLGTFTITLTVDDGLASSSNTVQVSTRDATPPVVTSSVALSSLLLFDHNLVNVGLTATAVDNCDGVRPVTVSVLSNESETASTGDGTFSPDAKYLAPGTLVLRDERIGSGTGRVYLIEVTAQDKSGNVGVACPTVVVPHDLTTASMTFINTQAASAAAYCQANIAAPTGYFADGYGPEIGPKQ